MADFNGNDQILIKIAVLGITFSMIATLGLTILWTSGGDYNYDQINKYRGDLIEFSGQGMINQSPWVLTHVYTPWIDDGSDIEDHIDPDGWMFGEDVAYDQVGKSANIRLNKDQWSSVPISVSDQKIVYTTQTGTKWWADDTGWYGWLVPVTQTIGEALGGDPYEYTTYNGNIWNYNGYRYVFDPTLPFAEGTSSRDGSLSIVWYKYSGQEGLAGGLQVYGGDVILAAYSAADIIADYDITNAYATTYDFVFNGVNLTLHIRFDPDVIEAGTPLMQAWTNGNWTMAISSLSAGNFYDVENSAAFTNTAGAMIDTFVKIYTFDIPQVSNQWGSMIIWLLVGLPMTIAMLCVTLRLVSSVRLV